MSGESPLCDVCEAEAATVRCNLCNMHLCEEDDLAVHKPAKFASHQRTPIAAAEKPATTTAAASPPPSASPSAASPSPSPTAAAPAVPAAVCDLCELDTATISCVDCDQQHCESCSLDLHKPARLAGHTRKPITKAAASSPPSSTDATAKAAQSSARGGPAKPSSPKASPQSQPAAEPVTAASPPPKANDPAPPRSAAVAPSTPPQQQQPQSQQKPKEEEKEPSPSPSTSAAAAKPRPSSAAASPAVTPAAKPARPSSAKPQPATPSTQSAAAASPVSPPAASTPAPKPRAMSASRSTSSLRSNTPSSTGRPRSAMPARSPGGGSGSDGTSSTASLLSTAPRSLKALSPTRNVLAMSEGSRWIEPDTRPFKGERVGTFGSTQRDGSPSRTKNLLYSKSASDLLGTGAGGANDAASWNRLSRPKVFVSSVISPLFEDMRECRFAPAINPVSAAMAPGHFHDRLEKSVSTYVTRALQPPEPPLPQGATFQPKLNHSRSAGRLGEPSSSTSSDSPSSGSSGNGSTKSSSRAEFLARMHSDWEKRRQKAEQLASQLEHPFMPQLFPSSKKRASRITTPFLERLAEDLTTRQDGAQMRQQDAERLPPNAFTPNADRASSNRKLSFDVFLARMQGDLEERQEKYAARCRQFGLPPPEEVVAMNMSKSTANTRPSSGSSTRRR